MTIETVAPLSYAAAFVLATFMVCAAALSAWRSWLGLKRLELERSAAPAAQPQPAAEAGGADEQGDTGTRIELAAMKERLRRLEAIAAGVEL